MLLAPVAVWQASRVARGAYGERERWGSVAFWAVALLIASAGVELAAVATISRRLNPGRLNPRAAGDGDQAAHERRRRAHERQRRARQRRPADDLHERAGQPVVRAQEAAALAIERGQRARLRSAR